MDAISNNTSKLGCRLLQTYALTIQKLLPSFSASQVCLIPLSSSTSFIRFMGLSIVLFLYHLFGYKDIKSYAIQKEKERKIPLLNSKLCLKHSNPSVQAHNWDKNRPLCTSNQVSDNTCSHHLRCRGICNRSVACTP